VNSGPRITTKHAELTLEQLADALPGTGDLMRSVGHCYAMTWHAAHGGNWDLAAYYFRRVRSILRGLAVVRPKYAAQVRDFDGGLLEDAYQALLAHDLGAFDGRFQAAAERANEYHVETGHPYIRWKLPAQPPDGGVDLNA
jgi:hypothetical protein